MVAGDDHAAGGDDEGDAELEVDDDGIPDESWDDLAEAPLEFDPADAPEDTQGERDDVFVSSDGEEYQAAQGASTPRAPPRDVQARHNLTHLPYASWCPWCVMGRRANSPHFRSRDGAARSLPLLVLDYAFVRDREDEELATLLIGKLYPSRKVLACVVEAKGVADPYGVNRVAAFIKESGLNDFHFVIKSDQESSIQALVEAAIRRSGRNGTVVPESSAVGESASNARAERTVQAVEDLLRVHKHALEARIGERVASDSAVLKWLVEHTADLLTKYTMNDTGQSPYEELHGRKVKERRVEFGERVYFHTPKKGRAKLDKRWRLGIYLGHASNSNEQFVGLRNGNVIRTRSTTRVVARSRWDARAVLGVIGTPADPTPTPDEELTPDDIEASEAPHDFAEAEVDPEAAEPSPRRQRAEETQSDEREPLPPEQAALRRIRITRPDIERFGYTPGCPRCTAMEVGDHESTAGHNDTCRTRMYGEYKRTNHPKWRRAMAEAGLRVDSSEPADSSREERRPARDDGPPPKAPRRESAASSSQDAAAASSSRVPPPPSPRQGPAPSTPRGPAPPTPEEVLRGDRPPPGARLRPGVGGPPRVGRAHEPPPPPPQDMPLESDSEEFAEPEAKRARRRSNSEDNAADVFGNFSDDEEQVARALILCGVSEDMARRKAKDITQPSQATFIEMYGRGEIVREANTTRRDLNVKGLNALDLRTSKADGTPWDFNLR